MSLLSQKSYFYEGSQSLILESDPRTISTIEIISIVLGAKEDELLPHHFYLNSKNSKQNKQVLNAIEMIWKEIPNSNISKISICFNNESLVIEGDDEKFKALLALLQVFGKDISSQKVYFEDYERCSYCAVYDVAEKLGILPA